MFRFVRRVFGRDAEFIHVAHFFGAGVKPGIFQHAAFETDVEKITVRRVRRFCGSRDRDLVSPGECDHLGASGKLFPEPLFAPGRNHAEFRRESCGR